MEQVYMNKRKKRKDNNYRVHIKIENNDNICIYHIFKYDGKTLACIELFENNDYNYYFVEHTLPVLDFASIIKFKPGRKRHITENQVGDALSRLKIKIINDFKYSDARSINDYLHYVYTINDCERKDINL